MANYVAGHNEKSLLKLAADSADQYTATGENSTAAGFVASVVFSARKSVAVVGDAFSYYEHLKTKDALGSRGLDNIDRQRHAELFFADHVFLVVWRVVPMFNRAYVFAIVAARTHESRVIEHRLAPPTIRIYAVGRNAFGRAFAGEVFIVERTVASSPTPLALAS
jgi:hypothetical protein